MSASPSPPRMLSHEVLLVADAVYRAIEETQRMAIEGRKAEALRSLALLANGVAMHHAVLRGVIRTQQQAAEALNLAQRPDIRVFASIGIAAEHPDASNDEAHPTTTNPAEPAPSSPAPGAA